MGPGLLIIWLKKLHIKNQNIDNWFPAWYTKNALAPRKTQKYQYNMFHEHITSEMSCKLVDIHLQTKGTKKDIHLK